METKDQATFVAKAQEVFAKAKIGDPNYPFKIKEELERKNLGLRIKLDDDGQPLLESLAAALYHEHYRLMFEMALAEVRKLGPQSSNTPSATDAPQAD